MAPVTATSGTTVARPPLDVDELVQRVVRILLARDELTVEQLAEATGLKRTTLFRRINGSGRGFTAAEIAVLADFFDVPVGEFYAPSGPLLGGLAGGFRKAPFLTLVPEQRNGAHDNSANAPAA